MMPRPAVWQFLSLFVQESRNHPAHVVGRCVVTMKIGHEAYGPSRGGFQ